MSNVFTDWDAFKHPDYNDMYDEAHRRSPTPLKVPLLSSHFAIWHPGRFEVVFRWYMTHLLLHLDGLQASTRKLGEDARAERLKTLRRWVNQLYLYYDESQSTPLVEKLVFHFDHDPDLVDEARVVWRLEVHREYTSITIFRQLKDAEISAMRQETEEFSEPDAVSNSKVVDSILREVTSLKLNLLEAVGERVKALFSVFGRRMLSGQSWVRRTEETIEAILEEAVEDKLPSPELPPRSSIDDAASIFWALAHELGSAARNGWAALFYGERDRIRTREVRAEARAKAAANLGRFAYFAARKAAGAAVIEEMRQQEMLPHYLIPDALVSDSQLNVVVDYHGFVLPKDVFRQRVGRPNMDFFPEISSEGLQAAPEKRAARLSGASEFLSNLMDDEIVRGRLIRDVPAANIVACFVFDGHFLFISTIGQRRDAEGGDRSPGMYWLFYDSFRRKTADQEDTPTDRRASRLVYMLNTIGTARVAALYNMKPMKDFSQHLRALEQNAIGLREFEGGEAIRRSQRFRRRLRDAEREVKESIIYRASRTAYYQSILRTQMQDARIIPIPSWQGLEAFIRRHLDPSISYIAGLGQRYESLNRLASDEYILNIGGRIYKFQSIADGLIIILTLYYLPNAMENMGRALKWFHGNQADIGRHIPVASRFNELLASNWLWAELPEILLTIGVAAGVVLTAPRLVVRVMSYFRVLMSWVAGGLEPARRRFDV